MDFQKMKNQTTVFTPQHFLTTVLTHEQDEDSSIIFSQQLEEQFEQTIQYLASEETISLEDLAAWKDSEFLIVAQTIDGDYIAGTIQQTLVIPVSLYKADIEVFDLQLPDFFIEYTNGRLNSTILPKQA